MKPILTLALAGCFSLALNAQSWETVAIFPLGSLPDSLYLEGYYIKAAPYAEEAVARIRAQTPVDSILLAKALFRQGNMELLAGNHANADRLSDEAWSIYYGIRGLSDDTSAILFRNLIESWTRNHRWEEAEALIAQVLEEAASQTGMTDYGRALLVFEQGWMYHNRRRYAEAMQCYEQVGGTLEALGRQGGQDYAWLNAVTGMLKNSSGKYQEAKVYARRALGLWEAMLGKEHTVSAGIYNSLGLLHGGDIFYMREMLNKALGILEKKLGPDAWYAGIIHYNLVGVYFDIGDIDQSEYHLRRAMEIIEKTSGRQKTEYPMLLASLGNILEYKGAYEQAEACYRESRTLREQLLTKKHPHYASATTLLAGLLMEHGRPAEALPLLEESLTIQVEIDGLVNHWTFPIIQRLAYCHAYLGDYNRADSLLAVAEDVIGHVYGETSREVADNQEFRAEIAMMRGDSASGVAQWLREAGAGRRQLIDLALPRASGRELESLVGAFQGHYELGCYAAERYGLGELAYDNALYFKNLALNTLSALRQEIVRSDDVLCKQRFEEWTGLQSVLATELAAPAASRGNTDSLQQALNLVERELSALVGDVFGEARPSSRWREVQASLLRGEAAVEFVAYRPPVLAGKREKRYGAAVLRPGDSEPRFVFLFEESELLSLLERVEESPSALYTRGGRVLDSRPVYGEALYQLLWKPLEEHLGGARTVYYVPDGLLHQIAFDALPVGRKDILADRYHLRRLSSTVGAGRGAASPDFRTAAVFGGAAYEESTEEAQDTLLPGDPGAQLWGVAERPRGYFEDGFDYLPGTEQEVGQLHQLFIQKGISSHLYTREEVTEPAIKALGEAGGESPDILHIATHGFYFPPSERGENLGKNAFYWHENPLFRSGLVLAGANKAWRGEGEGRASADGILTAYEISTLDLSRTRLVTLSACETGLGDLRGAEGVYGLRRAFKMAGAGTLLVSLWPAPDRETPEFMGYFYRHLLDGSPIHQAFRKAQRKMRRQHPEVVKWGCWVLVE